MHALLLLLLLLLLCVRASVVAAERSCSLYAGPLL
jgi:hypothetical protein